MIDFHIPVLTHPFFLGFIGSALVEVLTIFRYYLKGRMPMRYRKFGFWVVRVLLALGGGFFASVYNPANPILAIHIGASTPLIIASLMEAAPNE